MYKNLKDLQADILGLREQMEAVGYTPNEIYWTMEDFSIPYQKIMKSFLFREAPLPKLWDWADDVQVSVWDYEMELGWERRNRF